LENVDKLIGLITAKAMRHFCNCLDQFCQKSVSYNGDTFNSTKNTWSINQLSGLNYSAGGIITVAEHVLRNKNLL